MSSYPSDPGSYEPLLTGDYGFILALALTMFICLMATFLVKAYFSYQKVFAVRSQIGTAANAIVVSDAMWLAAHVSTSTDFPRLSSNANVLYTGLCNHIFRTSLRYS